MSRLIQLVSAQVMQNLLPALAVEGLREVVQIRSSGESYARSAAFFEKALQVRGVAVPVRCEVVDNPFPSIAESEQAVRSALGGGGETLVNITGGTKLMSIGAHAAAISHGCPILYCDSHHGRFLATSNQTLPGMHTFEETARALDLRTVLAAHGKNWKAEMPDSDLLEFGRAAWELYRDYRQEVTGWIEELVATIPMKDRRISNKKTQLRRFVETVLPAPRSEPASAYLDAAFNAGLLAVSPTGGITFACGPEKSKVERVRNLLQGSWFEYTIAGLLMRIDRYADIRLSLQPDTHHPSDFGETDIVAIDTVSCRLAIFSCKTSLRHVSQLEHLASIRDRATRLGGNLAAATLCVAFGPEDQRAIEGLRSRARLMNVDLLLGSEEVESLNHD